MTDSIDSFSVLNKKNVNSTFMVAVDGSPSAHQGKLILKPPTHLIASIPLSIRPLCKRRPHHSCNR